MEYQLLANGESVFSISIYSIVFLLILITGVLVVAGKILWKKLKAYETLKYEFVTIIAHKFRTPLTQMKWLIETVLEKEEDSYKIESLKSIEASNQKLISLTGTLIELTDSANTSLATYSFEKINLCELTTQVANSLKDFFHEKNLFYGFSMQFARNLCKCR